MLILTSSVLEETAAKISEIRNYKANLFLSTFLEPKKNEVLEAHSDLAKLYEYVDVIEQQVLSLVRDDNQRESVTDFFAGIGAKGLVFYDSIAMAMRNGNLDDVTKINLNEELLAFDKEKLQDVIAEAYVESGQEEDWEDTIEHFKNAPLDNWKISDKAPLYEAMNALQDAYPQDSIKSSAIFDAVAFNMFAKYLESRGAIIKQAPNILAPAAYIAALEQGATTPAEKAALPYVTNALSEAIKNQNPVVATLNVQYQHILVEAKLVGTDKGAELT